MSPLVDMTRRRTAGPARNAIPIYVDLLPPCNHACPAGEDIQGWLALAQAGKVPRGMAAPGRDNPFPAVHGRVCYHPCETACNRGELDSAVSIHAVERFLGDLADARKLDRCRSGGDAERQARSGGGRGPERPVGGLPSGPAGPSGRDPRGRPLPGGMLHFGIPAYRLPRDVLMQEIARIEAMGVKIVLNHKVEDVLAEQTAGKFDAVFVAIGAQIGKRIDIPARDAAQVIDAVTLLHDVETGERAASRPPRHHLWRRQHGDGRGPHGPAARRRRGADRLSPRPRPYAGASVRSRRGAVRGHQDQMAQHDQRDRRGRPHRRNDGSWTTKGRPQPTGQFETLSADSVVLALGQQTDSGFLRKRAGHRLHGRRHRDRRCRT